MLLKKNDIINLKITSATAEGSGVGKTDEGMAVFVPMSAIGDVLEVKILKVKKAYAFGKTEKILISSKTRITPDCPCFSKCGGCAWRHISYDGECAIKEQRVYDAVKRIGGFSNVKFNPIIRCGKLNRYRNKAQYPIGTDSAGNTLIGFYAFHSHRIVNCDDCLLQPEIFSRIVEVTREFIENSDNDIYDESTGKGRLRHLFIRRGEISGELMICYVVNGGGLKQEDYLVKLLKNRFSDLKSVIINSNREKTNVILGKKNRVIYGREYITDKLCNLDFKISHFSFWQVNRAQAEKLYATAKEYSNLKSDEVLLDLYCGTGTIGLTMAQSCKLLIGVEIVESAVADAVKNAEINGIKNARFICSDASQAAKQLKREGLKPDVVILDPPRKGCGEELVKIVAEMQPKRLVYISCDPATLARDLKFFGESGYIPLEITPCDMFSRTSHVESAALIVKKQNTEVSEKKNGANNCEIP